MEESIDSLVKGAPQPGTPAAESVSGTTPIGSSLKDGDPLNHTPSSPSMIYLNLLVLEASLRAQYLELRARRRHHTFFLTLLTLWIAAFGYGLFFAPREDGGHGGSVYWGVEVAQKVCFMGGVITAILVWGTGIWDRGIRWPRRWLAVSNRGLRGFNCKLVLIRRSWWAELASTVAFFLTYGLFSHTASSSYRYVDPAILREVEKDLNIRSDTHTTLPILLEDEERGGHEEDLSPGGDYVKLLLLPKYFTANFRENWELYRTEYWERENERRALLRSKLKSKSREYARQRWGIFWWMPWHQSDINQYLSRERTKPARRHSDVHRHRRNSVRRGSTSSSRSATPTIEMEDPTGLMRKVSSGSATSEKARKRLSATSVPRRRPESRSVTPDIPSPLAQESHLGDDVGAMGYVRRKSSGASLGSAKEFK